MSTINPKFAIYQDLYSDEKYTSINTLSELKLAKGPVLLHSAITQLFARFGASGDGSAQFPLYLSTLGAGNVKLIDSEDLSFKDRVIGKARRGAYCASNPYTSSDTPGKNKVDGIVRFRERFFERDHEAETPSRVHVKFVSEPYQEGDYWVYKFRVTGNQITQYVPYTDFAVGKQWVMLPTRVGLWGSRGNAFKGQAWSEVRNSGEVVRDTLNYKGNVSNKVMNFQVQINGKTYGAYTEFEKYLFELQLMEKMENSLWWSRYNRDTEGRIMDKDINSGAPRPTCSGIDEQITNTRYVSDITEKIMSDTIDEVFWNAKHTPDAGKVIIDLHTGTLGRRLFSNALHNKLSSLGLSIVGDDKFVRKAGGDSANLEYGGYFVRYRHIDGHVINIVQNAVLDKGARAMADPEDTHPDYPTLPRSSGDMYFIDRTMYDGKPNLVFVAEKGRVATEKAVLGVNDMSKMGYSSDTVGNDIDGSSIEFIRTGGLHHTRPTNSFKLLIS